MFPVGNWFDKAVGTHRGQWDEELSIDTAALPYARVGIAYSFQLAASGAGVWSMIDAPSFLGASVSAGGVLSFPGPAAEDTMLLVVQVTSQSGRPTRKALTLNIVPVDPTPPTIPVLTADELPSGQVGIYYDQAIPYSYLSGGVVTIALTNLPPGLASADSGRRIQGTPSLSGTFSPGGVPTGDGVNVGERKSMVLRILGGAAGEQISSPWNPALAGIHGGRA